MTSSASVTECEIDVKAAHVAGDDATTCHKQRVLQQGEQQPSRGHVDTSELVIEKLIIDVWNRLITKQQWNKFNAADHVIDDAQHQRLDHSLEPKAGFECGATEYERPHEGQVQSPLDTCLASRLETENNSAKIPKDHHQDNVQHPRRQVKWIFNVSYCSKFFFMRIILSVTELVTQHIKSETELEARCRLKPES